MKWRDLLVRAYAGHPLRVAANLLLLAALGILLGHWGMAAPLGDELVIVSMTPGLVAVVSAAIFKEKDPRHRA